MAQSTDNVVTYGIRGMIGKLLVFKRKGDKMVNFKFNNNHTTKPKINFHIS